MERALVLNAQAKHGLVAIRSLGRRGVCITAGSRHARTAGGLSKYTDRFLRYPDPEVSPDGFLRAVEAELQTHEYDMLLPINEVTVEQVVRHSDRFEPYTNVPFLPYDRLRIGLDKAATVDAVRDLDIPQPETLLPGEVDLDAVGSELGYPVVVKPTHGSSRNGVSVCECRAELERVYRDTRAEHGRTLLQEFVPHGGEYGVYTLYDRSSTLCRVTVQRRLRSNPPEGGASTYRETVADPELVSLADDLLSALDWQGVAMAEFRVDPRDGEPKLMEVNPRFWGSLALSVFAGVDFPYHLYRFAVGEPIERDLSYETGVRARCLFTDGQQVLKREDRLRALAEFLTPSAKPCRFDIVSVSDPLPALGQVQFTLGTLLERHAAPSAAPSRVAEGQQEVRPR